MHVKLADTWYPEAMLENALIRERESGEMVVMWHFPNGEVNGTDVFADDDADALRAWLDVPSATGESSRKWYYAYGEDEIPQQMPFRDNGYDGPFDTWQDAVVHLLERHDEADNLVRPERVSPAEYSLPVAAGDVTQDRVLVSLMEIMAMSDWHINASERDANKMLIALKRISAIANDEVNIMRKRGVKNAPTD